MWLPLVFCIAGFHMCERSMISGHDLSVVCSGHRKWKSCGPQRSMQQTLGRWCRTTCGLANMVDAHSDLDQRLRIRESTLLDESREKDQDSVVVDEGRKQLKEIVHITWNDVLEARLRGPDHAQHVMALRLGKGVPAPCSRLLCEPPVQAAQRPPQTRLGASRNRALAICTQPAGRVDCLTIATPAVPVSGCIAMPCAPARCRAAQLELNVFDKRSR